MKMVKGLLGIAGLLIGTFTQLSFAAGFHTDYFTVSSKLCEIVRGSSPATCNISFSWRSSQDTEPNAPTGTTSGSRTLYINDVPTVKSSEQDAITQKVINTTVAMSEGDTRYQLWVVQAHKRDKYRGTVTARYPAFDPYNATNPSDPYSPGFPHDSTSANATHIPVQGNFNGDSRADTFHQPKLKNVVAGILPDWVHAYLDVNLHRNWNGAHPDIPQIKDWSAESYGAFAGNLSASPGDELLLLGHRKLILLHGDIITPIAIYPEVHNAIISWDANGNATYTEFDFDANPADFNIHIGDLSGDGLSEIFLQAKSKGATSYILNNTGALVQTLQDGLFNMDWSAASYSVAISGGSIQLVELATGATNVARTNTQGAVVNLDIAVTKPTISNGAPRYIYKDQAFNFIHPTTSVAPLTVTATGQPDWMQVNTATAQFTGTPLSMTGNESYSIYLNVHENKSLTRDNTLYFKIDVLEAVSLNNAVQYDVYKMPDGESYFKAADGTGYYQLVREGDLQWLVKISQAEFNASGSVFDDDYRVIPENFNYHGALHLIIYDPFPHTPETHNSIVGNFNGDQEIETYYQPKTPGVEGGIIPNSLSAEIDKNYHQNWTTTHPQIPQITDWSEQSYRAFSGNFSDSPGKEILLLGKLQGGQLPVVNNAIVSWANDGTATFREFLFDANAADYIAMTGDLTGDGYDEIFLQSRIKGSASHLLTNQGVLIQTLNNGDQNMDWSADTHQASIVDGSIHLLNIESGINYVASTHTNGTIKSITFQAIPVADQPFQAPVIPENQQVLSSPASAGVAGGSASYSIPVFVPPGRAGIQPSVSLNYSSTSGNGIAGVGWSLSAASAISRCGNTVAQDGFTKGVNYALTDKLCLNGSRLVQVDDLYLVSGATHVYRTEIDQQLLVVQYGELSQNTASFEVRYKNNQKAYFGNTTDSKVRHSGAPQHIAWNQSALTDASGNNRIDYKYTTYGAGEVLLTNIYYTGTATQLGNRQVTLTYQDNGHYRFAYLAGGKSETTKKLKNISSYYAGSLVRSYDLTFVASGATGRDLLKSVKECGKDLVNSCLPLTTFDWQDNPTSYVVEPMNDAGTMVYPLQQYETWSLPLIASYIPHGDRNGDGTRDWKGLYFNAEEEKTDSTTDNLGSCVLSVGSKRLACHEADFNLDGRTDSIDLVSTGSSTSGSLTYDKKINIRYAGTTTWKDTDITLYNLNSHASNRTDDEILSIADYNGDGYVDLVIFRASLSAPTAELYLHSGNDQTPYHYNQSQTIFTYPLTGLIVSERLRFMGDLTGDALPDMVVDKVSGPLPATSSYNYPSALSQHILINTSTVNQVSFIESTKKLPNNNFNNNLTAVNLFHDFNGDGLADFITYSSAGFEYYVNQGNAQFAQVSHTGENFDTRHKYYPSGVVGEPFAEFWSLKFDTQFRVMDIDGDGLPELLEPDLSRTVAQGCTDIKGKIACDGQVYSQFNGTQYLPSTNNYISGHATSFGKQDYDVDLYQDGLYYFRVVRFQQKAGGGIHISREKTDIVGHVSENSVVDAYGRGASDFVFAYALRRTGNTVGTATGPMANYNNKWGIYINKAVNNANKDGYQANDLLSAVHQGSHNNAYQWVYRSLSSDEYDNNLLLDYPSFYQARPLTSTLSRGAFNFASSMYVVAEHKSKNAVGGDNSVLYRYKHGGYDRFGRGILGFEEIAQYDQASKVLTRKTFHQNFPLTGQLKSTASYEYSTNGWLASSLLSSQDYDWDTYYISVLQDYDIKDDNGDVIDTVKRAKRTGTQGVYLKSSFSQQFDSKLATPLLSSQTKNVTSIDQCGNVLESNQLDTDAYGQYVSNKTNVYLCDTESWWLNKLTSTSVTQKAITSRGGVLPSTYQLTLDQDKTLVTEYSDWDSSHRVSKKAVVTAKNALQQVEETVTTQSAFNIYGLPTSQSVTARTFNLSDVAEQQTRSSSMTYSENGSTSAADGCFLHSLTNAKSQKVVHQVDPTTGKPLKSTDIAGLSSVFQYDDFGRLLSQQVANLPAQVIRYREKDSYAPAASLFKTETYQAGSPTVHQYIDSQGNVIKSRTQAFDGSYVNQLVKYNNRGLKIFESIPYPDSIADDSVIGQKWSEFDVRGRATKRTQPTANGSLNRETTYTYNGLTVSINAGGLSMSRTFNSRNWLIETVDANSGITQYAYDGAGNPVLIRDVAGNIISAEYDTLGRKKWVNDANQGLTHFVYNGFGELEKQTDANNAVQRFTQDKLGRLTERQEILSQSASKVASFVWDTHRAGSLTSESHNGISKSYHYTSLGQVEHVDLTIDSQSYRHSVQYDGNYGRPKAMVYPNGLTLAYQYNADGYLQQELNAGSGYVYRQINSHDKWGNVVNASNTNGLLTTTASYHADTGQMKKATVTNAGLALQDISYLTFDNFGNLTQQRNDLTNSVENFTYDNLHRLTKSALTLNSVNKTIDYGYDNMGNLTQKSDHASSYSYLNTSHPNAVSAITKINGGIVNFAYDSRGNQLSSVNPSASSSSLDNRNISYNIHDKPLTINGGGNSMVFTYGADLSRYKQVRTVAGKTVTTHYVDKIYEVDYENNTSYFRAFIGNHAIVGTDSSQGDYVNFLHGDRLGSVATITDKAGNVVTRRSYDPFGKPRKGDFDEALPSTLSQIDNRLSPYTRKGFTQHEHLDEMQLIHMNGRVYDYNLGRFLSVDPFIQEPGNSQSMNPYSYIMNNPLAGTDPSGYRAKLLVKLIEYIFKSEKKAKKMRKPTKGKKKPEKSKEKNESKKQDNGKDSEMKNKDGDTSKIGSKPSRSKKFKKEVWKNNKEKNKGEAKCEGAGCGKDVEPGKKLNRGDKVSKKRGEADHKERLKDGG